jgi:hypothetical protein
MPCGKMTPQRLATGCKTEELGTQRTQKACAWTRKDLSFGYCEYGWKIETGIRKTRLENVNCG